MSREYIDDNGEKVVEYFTTGFTLVYLLPSLLKLIDAVVNQLILICREV